MKEKEDFLLEALKDEYFRLHELIESTDRKALNIKLTITPVLLSIILLSVKFGKYEGLLVVIFTAFTFLLIEASWRRFQYFHYRRIGEIERFFRNEKSEIYPLQIGTSWNISRMNKRSIRFFIKILSRFHVHFPYSFLILLSSVLYYLYDKSIFALILNLINIFIFIFRFY